MIKLWNRLFLEERSSISFSLFRVAVALTLGFHIMPSFCHLKDTYLSTAFKTFNASFFPISVIEWVQQSPDWVVICIVWIFFIFWFFFLIGLWSQISCIIMVGTCYYFYALNAFAMGTLSWDILLVTLFLMCITPYHGDYFSVDCLKKGNLEAYKTKRPFFLQRLLQMQLGFTYFYTALHKVTAEGNWITDNPIYYLMNTPMPGVTKTFLLRDFVYDKPELCYVLGICILVIEFLMIFLLFWRRTRISAIYLGIFFHIVLILTLDVPATFFFLFPAQFLLFINPNDIETWIENKRKYNQGAKRAQLLYDGDCGFCGWCVRLMKIMDLFDILEYINFQAQEDLDQFHPDLTKDLALKQIYLIEPDGKMFGGFFAIRQICSLFPMLYAVLPIVYFPTMGVIGPAIYKLVARNRYCLIGAVSKSKR